MSVPTTRSTSPRANDECRDRDSQYFFRRDGAASSVRPSVRRKQPRYSTGGKRSMQPAAARHKPPPELSPRPHLPLSLSLSWSRAARSYRARRVSFLRVAPLTLFHARWTTDAAVSFSTRGDAATDRREDAVAFGQRSRRSKQKANRRHRGEGGPFAKRRFGPSLSRARCSARVVSSSLIESSSNRFLSCANRSHGPKRLRSFGLGPRARQRERERASYLCKVLVELTQKGRAEVASYAGRGGYL